MAVQHLDGFRHAVFSADPSTQCGRSALHSLVAGGGRDRSS
jgi:hypothetical protein